MSLKGILKLIIQQIALSKPLYHGKSRNKLYFYLTAVKQKRPGIDSRLILYFWQVYDSEKPTLLILTPYFHYFRRFMNKDEPVLQNQLHS